MLITGGGGFLGSHLVDRVRREGLDPFVARRRDYDLTRAEDVKRLFEAAEPELVIHLAAEVGGIGANRDNPGRYWYANLMMGAHVLEQSRASQVTKLVLLGTICSYPKFAPTPFHEDDLWNGYPEETNAPYGVAKKALLVGAQGYREQYGLDSVYLLPVNLYGPGDKFDLQTSHVIPALIRKMVEAQERGENEIVLWGDGSPTREFLFVEDAAEGIWLAAQRYDGAEPVNLGTGAEISIRELADLIAELIGYTGEIVWDTTKPNGQPRRRLDVSRAEELFGFHAQNRAPRRSRAHDLLVSRDRSVCRRSMSALAVDRSWFARRRSAIARWANRVEDLPVPRVLATFVVVQWLAVLATARTVRHAGWIYYQGGDQLWYYTLGWLVGHGQLTQTQVGYGWSAMISPIARIAGPNLVSALPAIVLLNVLVLLPIALVSLYGIAARIGGRLFGYWALLLWIGLPFIGILYTNPGYHQRYTELTLPQSFGLTAMSDFAAMVATLVSIYFLVKTLLSEHPQLLDGVAAGVAAGAAIAIKPATSIFLVGPCPRVPLQPSLRDRRSRACGDRACGSRARRVEVPRARTSAALLVERST